MAELNIEKFNPTVAEIKAMVEQYKDFTIAGVDDHKGYLMVDTARKQLKKSRVQIEKDGKMLRAEAIAFQKAVIAKEKELIGMIEPTEKELAERQKTIDDEREMIKRKQFLPERVQKLQLIGVTVEDTFLLMLDENQWQEFYNIRYSEYLQEQGRKALEEKRKAEEALAAEQKKLEEEKRKAVEEMAEQQRKLEAEKKKIEDEKLAMEREKQKQIEIEAAKKLEAERVKKEMEQKAQDEAARKQREEQDRIMAEKAEQEAIEKKAKYKKFLERNGYVEGEEFYILRDEKKLTLYKKVDQITL